MVQRAQRLRSLYLNDIKNNTSGFHIYYSLDEGWQSLLSDSTAVTPPTDRPAFHGDIEDERGIPTLEVFSMRCVEDIEETKTTLRGQGARIEEVVKEEHVPYAGRGSHMVLLRTNPTREITRHVLRVR